MINHTPPPSLNTIFSGTVQESDLTGNTAANNYIVSYHLVLVDAKFENNKLYIYKAELGIGAKPAKGIPAIDVNEERKEIKENIDLYTRLMGENPDYKGKDGLTYEDLLEHYKKLDRELENIESPLIDHLKTQIVDRINTDYGDKSEVTISDKDIRIIPFNKVKMSKMRKVV